MGNSETSKNAEMLPPVLPLFTDNCWVGGSVLCLDLELDLKSTQNWVMLQNTIFLYSDVVAPES